MSVDIVRRFVLYKPVAVLSWLGRQGTGSVAALLVAGIVMPSIGALLKPFVSEAVFLLLCIAFLRVDPGVFRVSLRRPTTVLAATTWTSFVIPTLFGASYLAFGLEATLPDLFLALVLQAVASPLVGLAPRQVGGHFQSRRPRVTFLGVPPEGVSQ